MRLFFLSLLLVLSCLLCAQEEPIYWGKIDPADLNFTDYELDSEAEALVLCDYGVLRIEEMTDGYKYRFNHIRRVKILKESGLDRGDIVIPFYHHEQGERLSNLGAQVFLPDGKKQTLSKKDFFEEKRNQYWSAKKFSIPNLQVGSVFEYHYEIVSNDLTHLREWTFQEDIPIRHSELQITIPAYFEYIFLLSGQELIDASTQKEGSAGSSLKIKSAKNPFILKDIPAIHEERFITCMDDYTLGIRFQLSKINYPDGRVEPILTSWDQVAKEIEEHRFIAQQYNKPKNYKKLLALAQPSLDAATSPAEKVEAAAQFLRQQLNSSGYYSYSARTSLDRLLERQEVHSGEINLMLMALLKASDIPVYPLLVSTRDHGQMIATYPIMDQFNHLMVCAIIDQEAKILDLGDPFRRITYPRINALNKIAWLVDGEQSRWVEVNAPSSRQVFLAELALNETGELAGMIKTRHSGYDAVTERSESDENSDGSHWLERFQKQFPEASIGDFKTEYSDDLEEDFRNQFSAVIPGAVQSSEDLLYIKPILYSQHMDNPLKMEERNYPVDFAYPSKEQYILKLQIPEGYAVESLPENYRVISPNNGASFQYKAVYKDGEIQVLLNFQLNQLEYQPKDYKALKDFFNQVISKMEDLIVLKKI